MSCQSTYTRRQFIKLGGLALSAMPFMVVANKSGASTNAAMRNGMKYQNKPDGDKSCAACSQFIAGKTDTDSGGCKLFFGDTEISPQGYCVAWVARQK